MGKVTEEIMTRRVRERLSKQFSFFLLFLNIFPLNIILEKIPDSDFQR